MTDAESRRIAGHALAVLDRARAVVAALAAGTCTAAVSPTARTLLTSSRDLLHLLEIARHEDAHDRNPARR